MVFLSARYQIYQELQARDDDAGAQTDQTQDGWGTVQIAAPIIVGVVLLLIFSGYLLWVRKTPTKLPYNYHQVRGTWISRLFFTSRRVRHRVLPSNDRITLDDSILTPSTAADFRRARQHRQDSADSQTPLTQTSYGFDYPPKRVLLDTPPQKPEQKRPWRWWRLLGSRPQEIKSEEPSSRWRVDGPDGSSTGHGIQEQEDRDRTRYTSGLEAVDERVELESVIRIGDNFSSIESTPVTQNFHEEEPATLTPPSRTASVPPQNAHGTPRSSRANTPLPPGYRSSTALTSHGRHPSTEELVRPARSDPYMLFPPPVRAAGYGTPHMFGLHGRQMSSDSFLETQAPITPPFMY
ncbi:hypothetical protein F5I97DRAFT_780853 [Phlebopus sp. FC_14]|nr:hypothetical protein F5I97DRAFT_780853 [Phlebopus sp. FC_14]